MRINALQFLLGKRNDASPSTPREQGPNARRSHVVADRIAIRRTLLRLASRQRVDSDELTSTVLGCHAIASQQIDWSKMPMASAPGGEAFRAQGSWAGVVRRDLGSARMYTRVSVFGDHNFYLPPRSHDAEHLLTSFCQALARTLTPTAGEPAQPRTEPRRPSPPNSPPQSPHPPRLERWASFVALELWLLQPFYDGNRRAGRALALGLLRAAGDETTVFPSPGSDASDALDAQCFAHLNHVLQSLDLLRPHPQVFETRHGVPILDYRPESHAVWARYWSRFTKGLVERYSELTALDVEEDPNVQRFAAQLVKHSARPSARTTNQSTIRF
ncbi:MAG: hypothetical protein IPK13_26205 [Deltaproteobacteria bacterium]|nr:hypothetical protein [Deltaproteobacteria bacterium]